MVVSTVTAVVAFDLGPQSLYQYSISIPTTIFPTEANRKVRMDRFEKFRLGNDDIHRHYRMQLIRTIVADIASDCKMVNNEIADSVSSPKEMEFKDFFSYNRVQGEPRETEILDLDCMEVNPNAYASLSTVLDKLLDYANSIGRNYLPIYMDGSPFTICCNLIRDTHICGKCQQVVSVKDIENHLMVHDAQFTRKYKTCHSTWFWTCGNELSSVSLKFFGTHLLKDLQH